MLMFIQYSEEFELIYVHDVRPKVNRKIFRSVFVLMFDMGIQVLCSVHTRNELRDLESVQLQEKQGLFTNIR
jgi:hypothetical protein